MITRNSSQQPAVRSARPAPTNIISLGSSIEMMAALIPFARDAEIYGESEPAHYLYKVASEAVRTYKVLNDGRRHFSSFYQPGDIFGLEIGGEHPSSAEAVADFKIQVISRSEQSRSPGATRKSPVSSGRTTATELQRAQDHFMLLVKTAQERVAISDWKWRREPPAPAKLFCRCRGRTSPIISGSPSKRYRVR